MRLMNSKERAYQELVKKRKKYKFPPGLINPANVKNGIFDKEINIGPWCKWQGNLNAKIMLIGQDWGTVKYYIETKGSHEDESRTNISLIKLFKSIGIDIGTPSHPNHLAPCFFTNAILGLKDEKAMASKIKDSWIKENAKEFLQPNIKIIKPKIIITLGINAYKALNHIYCLKKDTLNQLIDKNPIKLENKSMLFAMYHCGGLGLANRKWELQKKDWKKIKDYIYY
jgi:DNA polymerase